MTSAICLLLAVGAAGHGMLTWPPSRVGGNLRCVKLPAAHISSFIFACTPPN